MDNVLFESLLNEGESPFLDFKEAQYKFISATDAEKAELLKDILAFANAWRHTQAYILIGVRGESAGRALPLGIENHIDDAKLQQFVNSKTNQPVNFKYYSFQFETKSFGIIEIDVQTRPIYLQKKFAGLDAKTVYLRRGSSTAVAAPDEIARMGAASVKRTTPLNIELQFAESESRSLRGKSIEIESVLFKPKVTAAAIQQRVMKNVFGGDNLGPSFQSPLHNHDFAVDVMNYETERNMMKKVGFFLRNNGNEPVTNLKINLSMERIPGLIVLPASALTKSPDRSIIGLHELPHDDEISVTTIPNSYETIILVDRLLPGDEYWSNEGIYIGSHENLSMKFAARILADQIQQPIVETLNLTINTRIVQRTLDEWMVIAFEYE